jgi:protein-disulfide isomerase
MDKRFWAIIGVIVIIFGGILVLQGNKKAAAPGGNNQPTNHVMGAGKEKVTLVEYGDYECPVCNQYYPVVKQVTAKYGDNITFQFRNLPLSQIHQNAFAGARAAEAAGLQNKYWEMHDILYENQQAWGQSKDAVPMFDSFAQQLGLNVTQFKKDFASSKVNNAINADLDAFAKTKQAQATPTFFLNGTYVKPAPTLSDFTTLIDAELKK